MLCTSIVGFYADCKGLPQTAVNMADVITYDDDKECCYDAIERWWDLEDADQKCIALLTVRGRVYGRKILIQPLNDAAMKRHGFDYRTLGRMAPHIMIGARRLADDPSYSVGQMDTVCGMIDVFGKMLFALLQQLQEMHDDANASILAPIEIVKLPRPQLEAFIDQEHDSSRPH